MNFKDFSRWVIERSARKGAEHLDRTYHGWEETFDLGTFRIGTYERGLLGQVHTGGYQQGLTVLSLTSLESCRGGLDLFPLAHRPSWHLFGTRSGFDYLIDCWKRLILERRQIA